MAKNSEHQHRQRAALVRVQIAGIFFLYSI